MSVNQSNAAAAWGENPPRYVLLLAQACDVTSQRDAGRKIGRSSATVSKVLNQRYPGSYAEVEQLVVSVFAADRVRCPVFDTAIALATCIRNRRRKGSARNSVHLMYDRACPNCPNNLERFDD